MKNIFIATSGYSYKDWKGVFYPKELSAGKYLAYYSKFFPFTELNFSYYKQPEERQSLKFLEETDKKFLFSIKAHQSLTHQPTATWKEDVKIFSGGIAPLSDANRLASVILQFPFSFKYTKENRIYLSNLCKNLSIENSNRIPLSIEFRNREWDKPSVISGMKEIGAGWIVSDNPELKGLPKGEMKWTSETAYLRFHGRNRENWWQGDNVSRYDYRYSTEELTEAAEAIKKMSGKVKRMFIAFNNHHKGQAVENALELKDLVESE
ncbi:MAG: DUF72 domain-containing protein [Spirochaetales bacterium]|nr:DUF72 domain-containing protein [Spirochaetales bacterium]